MRGPTNGLQDDRAAAPSPPSDRGGITILCGCMFSGKTTELFRRLDRCAPAEVVVYKHVIDRRYAADAVVSHAGRAWPATALSSPAQMLGQSTGDARVIALDEAHFFDADLVGVTAELARRGIDLIMTSLDRDSWGRPFELVSRLRAVADETVVLRATCARCGRDADRTQRLTPIVGGNMVGGPESYEPRCTHCWHAPLETPPP